MKNRWFCVLRNNPHSPKILKKATNIDHLIVQTEFFQQLQV